MKKKLAMMVMVSVMSCAVLTGCGGAKETAAGADLVYAVETGSAGEAVATEKGFKINSVASHSSLIPSAPFQTAKDDQLKNLSYTETILHVPSATSLCEWT